MPAMPGPIPPVDGAGVVQLCEANVTGALVAGSPAPAPPAQLGGTDIGPMEDPAPAEAKAVRTGGPHSTAELIEFQQGRTADAPLCLTCGTKMRPAGSCYVCEGCGSTSGCS